MKEKSPKFGAERPSAGFQPLGLRAARRLLLLLLLISFSPLSRHHGRRRRPQLLAVFSLVSLLPSLLHLADVLGKEGLQGWDQLRDHLQVAKANLHQEETEVKKKRFSVRVPPLSLQSTAWLA